MLIYQTLNCSFKLHRFNEYSLSLSRFCSVSCQSNGCQNFCSDRKGQSYSVLFVFQVLIYSQRILQDLNSCGSPMSLMKWGTPLYFFMRFVPSPDWLSFHGTLRTFCQLVCCFVIRLLSYSSLGLLPCEQFFQLSQLMKVTNHQASRLMMQTCYSI